MGLYSYCRETDYGVTGLYGISVADPGAVPGASTNLRNPFVLASWGRNRIDARGKDLVCARHGTTVIGLNRLIANDNFAGEARLAA